MLNDFLVACLALFAHTIAALATMDILQFFLVVMLFAVAVCVASWFICAGRRT